MDFFCQLCVLVSRQPVYPEHPCDAEGRIRVTVVPQEGCSTFYGPLNKADVTPLGSVLRYGKGLDHIPC